MILTLQVELPIACFRSSSAREYAETYPVPPPSTIYGMLLSLVGETDRYKHCHVELALALLSKPQISTVIRTFRRFKRKDIAAPENARPDYQELLTNVKFLVWVSTGSDSTTPDLVERLQIAFAEPQRVDRFGGLSLGESRDLINSVSLLSDNEQIESLQWLYRDEYGPLSLPYWVDHVGSKGTCRQSYSLQQGLYSLQPPELAWTEICDT
jgi:CRISPR-associated protein Cas5t